MARAGNGGGGPAAPAPSPGPASQASSAPAAGAASSPFFDTLDRAVLREIAVPFAAGLVLFCAVAAFGQLMKVADAVTGLGIAGDDVLRALAFSLPPLLGLLIPVALLFACLLAFGRLGADRELLGLSTLGVTPLRLLRVPLALGLVLGGVTAVALVLGEPWGIRGLRQLMARSAQRALAGGIRPGDFHAWIDGVVLYAGAADAEGLRDVLLADRREPGRPLTVAARRGRVATGAAANDVVLALEDGTMLLAPERAAEAGAARSGVAAGSAVAAGFAGAGEPGDAEGTEGAAGAGPVSHVVRFARGTYRLDVGHLVTNKARNLAAVQELSLAQLSALAGDASVGRDRAAQAGVALHRKAALPLAVPLFAALAVPLGVRGRSGVRARGLVVCSLIVAGYYYVGRAAELSARAGQLAPALAAWLPDVLALLALLALLPALRRRA